MGKGGGQNNTYEKHGGAKGVRVIARLLGGYVGILNLYPKRCIFRLICGSQMT